MRKFSILIVMLVSICISVRGQLTLSSLFSDNMVLQQQTQAPVWGTATANKTVKVITSWNNRTYATQSDDNGNWTVKVSTPVAGGPYSMTISTDKKNSVTLKNVMIGEVWICSGQSNMEMPIEGWGKVNNYKQEVSEANYPNIRLLTVKQNTDLTPSAKLEVLNNGWQACSPSAVNNFSAVAYFFGRDIHQSQHVPVGLIVSAWGGTVAEAWVSGQSLEKMPDFTETVQSIQSTTKSNLIADFKTRIMEWEDQVQKMEPGSKSSPGWASPSFDDKSWTAFKVPGLIDDQGLGDFDGFIWYRKEIELPASWAGKSLTVSLGSIDDNDVTYFNGVVVGRTEGYNKNRIYTIPAKLVKAGRAIIAVRVLDSRYGGGFSGDSKLIYIESSPSDRISLAGEWNAKTTLTVREIPEIPNDNSGNPNVSTVLYNAMIHPLVPYSIRGAIWYQGEANAGRAYQYRDLMPLLITDWRNKWQSDFPFYLVQLANFTKPKPEPAESDWAELREAQLFTANHLTNTGMAVTIDIGEADDIHPKNKQAVGARLALVARAKTYGEKIQYSGPVYETFRIDGKSIRITFKHAEGGLKTPNGSPLTGFVIAGPDHQFCRANAVIEGNEIVVSSPDVAYPVAVRYAWAHNPVCNLYNGEGLPASPFRTDDWIGVTYNKR